MGKTFEEFSETVISHIKDYLPDSYMDASVNIQEVKKNNGKLLHGLVIKRPGETLVPVIYLESFFEAYQKGTKIIEYILLDIVSEYQKVAPDADQYADIKERLMDWENVKEHVGMRLINAGWNTERLVELPFILMEDLAITFYVKLDEKVHIQVNHYIFNLWDISISDLYEQAAKNTVRSGIVVKTAMQLFREILGDSESEEIEKGKGLYILTTKKRSSYGAAAFLCPGVLKNIYQQIGNFTILPSCVHEVILAVGDSFDFAELREMVMEVNLNVVDPEERLSNNIYRYDPIKDNVEIIYTEQEEEYA